MKKGKILAVGMTLAMLGTLFTGCGTSDGSTTAGGDTSANNGGATGSVYYLNFKPEADKQWQELAQMYTDERQTNMKQH